MAKLSALPPNLPPRGLDRVAAAAYLSIGTTLFDACVRSGTFPKPKQIGGRKVWDVRALDRAFDALPDEGECDLWGNP